MTTYDVVLLLVLAVATASITRLVVTDGFPLGGLRRWVRSRWPAWSDQFSDSDVTVTLRYTGEDEYRELLRVPSSALPVKDYRPVAYRHAETGRHLTPEYHSNGQPTGLYVAEHGTWLGELTDCPYCTGMWVGFATAAVAVWQVGLPAWWWLPLALAYRQVAGRYS